MSKKKEVYKPKPMTENKRNLMQGLFEGYDIQTGYSDAVKPPVRRTGNRQSGQKETANFNIRCGKAATLENSNSSRVVLP